MGCPWPLASSAKPPFALCPAASMPGIAETYLAQIGQIYKYWESRVGTRFRGDGVCLQREGRGGKEGGISLPASPLTLDHDLEVYSVLPL